MLTINVQVDGQLAIGAIDWQKVHKSQANAAVKSVQENFLGLGGRSYWGQAAQSTTAAVNSAGVVISIAQVGVRLNWLGTKPGNPVVSPRPNGLMAIPVDRDNKMFPRRYGKPLAFIPIRKEGNAKGLLVEAEQRTAKRGKNKGNTIVAAKPDGQIVYILVDSFERDPNPDVIKLPDIGEAAKAATETNLKLQIKRNARKKS